jgi:uncharacterized membrane protein YvbJ
MFCPSCGKQNKEGTLFCEYCGKSMQKNVTTTPQATQFSKKAPKAGLSYNAKRGLLTGILIVVLVLVVLLIYYPNIFPWN